MITWLLSPDIPHIMTFMAAVKTSLFRNKTSTTISVLVPSPSLDTLYPTRFHNPGPSPLPTATVAAYSKLFPCSCECPDCISSREARRTPEQPPDRDLLQVPTEPQPRPVVSAIPFSPLSNAIPVRHPVGCPFRSVLFFGVAPVITTGN